MNAPPSIRAVWVTNLHVPGRMASSLGGTSVGTAVTPSNGTIQPVPGQGAGGRKAGGLVPTGFSGIGGVGRRNPPRTSSEFRSRAGTRRKARLRENTMPVFTQCTPPPPLITA